MLFLEDNLTKLNGRLSKHGLHFEKRGDEIILVEAVMYRLNNLPGLKKELREVYSLRFQGERKPKYWYIGTAESKKLSSRALKTQPSKSEADLRAKLTNFVEQIENAELKKGIQVILQENPFYHEYPAAKRHHHAYKHGLLEHTGQIIDLAFGMIKTFDNNITINSDLIMRARGQYFMI